MNKETILKLVDMPSRETLRLLVTGTVDILDFTQEDLSVLAKMEGVQIERTVRLVQYVPTEVRKIVGEAKWGEALKTELIFLGLTDGKVAMHMDNVFLQVMDLMDQAFDGKPMRVSEASDLTNFEKVFLTCYLWGAVFEYKGVELEVFFAQHGKNIFNKAYFIDFGDDRRAELVIGAALEEDNDGPIIRYVEGIYGGK